MGAADDNLAPIVKLGKLARAEGAKEGMALRGFGLVPDLEGGNAHVHLVYEVDPDHEAPAKDDSLRQLVNDPQAEHDRRADEARKRLVDLEQQLRDPNKGILGD